MTEPQPGGPAQGAGDRSPASERPAGEPVPMLSALGMFRVVVALLGVWALYSGLTLTIWQGIDVATVAGDLENGPAARLVGVHLLVLWPVFWLVAWDPERFRWFVWTPYAHQVGVFLVTALDVLTGKRDFTDAALPLVVTLIFLVLLGYIALMRRQAALVQLPAPEAPAPEPAPSNVPPPGEPPGEAAVRH